MTVAPDSNLEELRNAVLSLADIVHARDQLIHARKVLEGELADLERVTRSYVMEPDDDFDNYGIDLDDFFGPFVYALLRKHATEVPNVWYMETVYVGMTSRLLPRIGQHLAEGTKDFSGFDAWKCESEQHAKELERRLIEAYLPEYKKKHTGRPYRKAA